MMALAVAVATMGAMEEAGAMVATRAVAMGAVAAVVVATSNDHGRRRSNFR